MEVIYFIFALILIVAVLAFCVGVIKSIFKKQRATGKRIALFSFITVIVAIIALTELFQVLDEQAVEAGYKDYAEQQDAERQKKTKFETETLFKALNGFPDEETLAAAQSMGVTRYEAYKQRENKTTIARYCAYNVEGLVIEKAKHAAMDKTSSDAKQTEIWDEHEALQHQLLAKYNEELGLQEYELINLANAGNWRAYCNAENNNWSVLTEDQVLAATRADANEAVEALNAFYLWNLNNQTTAFFNNDLYSAVSCNWHNHNSMRFVGCQLISIGHKSNWQMFVVGRLVNGHLAVSPINGDTSEKLHTADARYYDGSADKRVFIQAYDQPRAYLANFVGPLIDIQNVRKLFE